MAAKAISDVESLWVFLESLGGENPKPQPTLALVSPALRAMIDDQAALKTAIDTIAAMVGPSNLATAVAAASAAQTASLARIA